MATEDDHPSAEEGQHELEPRPLSPAIFPGARRTAAESLRTSCDLAMGLCYRFLDSRFGAALRQAAVSASRIMSIVAAGK
jgi:hypothetical protein